MRDLMMDMYNTLTGPAKNVYAIADLDASNIKDLVPTGNNSDKERMNDFKETITFYQDIAKSAEIFEKQVLIPVKFSAQLVREMRKQDGRATTDLQCLTFARSYGTYDKFQNAKMVTVSTLCPKIGTTMNIRIREDEANKLRFGTYNFLKVQPIPLANRMKSVAERDKKFEITQITPNIADYDFLFANLDDWDEFSYSFEMRHYCEVYSSQTDHKQILGAVLIFSGKLLGTSGPIALVQHPTSGREVKFHVSDNKYGLGKTDNIEDLEGRFVRFIAAVWYESGTEETEKYPEYPEIFYIEDGGTEQDSKIHNIIGYSRLRGEITKDEVNRMGLSFGELPTSNFSFQHGTTRYVPDVITNDKIANGFRKVVQGIRSMRVGISESLLVKPTDFIDEKKVTMELLSRKKFVAETILNAIDDFESPKDYEYPRTPYIPAGENRPIAFFKPANDNEKRKISNFIKRHKLGIIEKEGNRKTLTVTKRGTELAFETVKDTLRRVVKRQMEDKYFSLESLGKPLLTRYGISSPIPESFFLRFLKEQDDIVRVFPDNSYYWMRKDADAAEVEKTCKEEARSYFTEVYKDMLLQLTYDFVLTSNPRTVEAERNRLFEILGHVIVLKPYGETSYWRIPTEHRILYYMKENGPRVSEEELVKKIAISSSLVPEDEVSRALIILKKQGKIAACEWPSTGPWENIKGWDLLPSFQSTDNFD